MNEKSKAIELIEFIWKNAKTNSCSQINFLMSKVLNLAIESKLKFDKEDYNTLKIKYGGGYWLGVNTNGKGQGEQFYAKACEEGNISFCNSYEHFYNFKPFKDTKGHRLYARALYCNNENRYRVTGFDFNTKKVHIVSYSINDVFEVGKKSLHSFDNKEWEIFKEQINKF